MMLKHKTTGSKPCLHMRVLVSAWVDGALGGVAEWYTKWHVAHCAQCASAVPFLRQLHSRLQELGAKEANLQLSEDRWAKVEAAWEHADG
jgi:hypothetical protein